MLTKKIVSIIYVLLIAGMCGLPASAQAFDVLLGTGAPGSFSYFSGRVLCRMLNSQMDDVYCQQVPAAVEIDNLTNLQSGSLDISLVDSRMLFDAVNKTSVFKFLDISYEKLRALGPLYDTPVTMIVRNDAGIGSLDDLKGKRINAGTPQSPQYLAVDTILKAKKWTKKDFSLVGDLPPSKSNDDKKAFCYGTMQAMVYIGIHPDFSLQRLLKTCNGQLLNMADGDIEKLVNGDPALWKIDLAAGTYPSHPKVETFGTRTILVASDNLDGEIAYKIIAAIVNNKQHLTNVHSALSLFSADTARESVHGMKLHPGAAKYLAEH